jgi:hypothetical protein
MAIKHAAQKKGYFDPEGFRSETRPGVSDAFTLFRVFLQFVYDWQHATSIQTFALDL